MVTADDCRRDPGRTLPRPGRCGEGFLIPAQTPWRRWVQALRGKRGSHHDREDPAPTYPRSQTWWRSPRTAMSWPGTRSSNSTRRYLVVCRRYRLIRADAEDVAQSSGCTWPASWAGSRPEAIPAGWSPLRAGSVSGPARRPTVVPGRISCLTPKSTGRQGHDCEQELLVAERHTALREALGRCRPAADSCSRASRAHVSSISRRYAEISASSGISVGIGPPRYDARPRWDQPGAHRTNGHGTIGDEQREQLSQPGGRRPRASRSAVWRSATAAPAPQSCPCRPVRLGRQARIRPGTIVGRRAGPDTLPARSW